MDRLFWKNTKFELYHPLNEAELETIIAHRYKEVFWEGYPDLQVLYFDIRKRIASKAKKICVPDGILLLLGKSIDECRVLIIEFELADHPTNHIVSQLLQFKNAIENIISRKILIDAIVGEIAQNEKYRRTWNKQISNLPFYQGCSELFDRDIGIVLVADEVNERIKEIARDIRQIFKVDLLQVKLYARIDRLTKISPKREMDVMALYPDGGNEWFRAIVEGVKTNKKGKRYKVKWFDGDPKYRSVQQISPVKDILIRVRSFEE